MMKLAPEVIRLVIIIIAFVENMNIVIYIGDNIFIITEFGEIFEGKVIEIDMKLKTIYFDDGKYIAFRSVIFLGKID